METLENAQPRPESNVGYVAIEVATQADDIGHSNGDSPVICVPKPPSPSIGGMQGIKRALGWTAGFLPNRTLTGVMTGQALRGHTPVLRADGPVGQSNYRGRLVAGVESLYNDYTPTDEQVAHMITFGNGEQS